MSRRRATTKVPTRQAKQNIKKGEKEKIDERKKRVDELIERGELDIGKDFDLSNTNFRFQNRRCMLTYKSHINKDKYRKWMNERKKGILEIHMAHETGDQHNNYDHTHVIIDFGKIHQTKNCRWFDYNEIHPHIKKILSQRHWSNCLLYLAKEDKANEYLKNQFKNLSIVEKIWECETEEEALKKYVKRPIDYEAVKRIFRDRRDERKIIRFEAGQLYPWEKAFLKINVQKGEGRTINWIYDERGKCGKTQWSYHMEDNYDDDWLIIDNIGSTSDFANNAKNYMEKNPQGCKGIIIDLPRSFQQTTDFYNCLEMICNGRLTATKYNGGRCLLGTPIIWVFANFKPNVFLMSKDRWRILEVSKGGKQVRLCVYDTSGRFGHLTKITHGIIGHSFLPDESLESSSSLDIDISFDDQLISM